MGYHNHSQLYKNYHNSRSSTIIHNSTTISIIYRVSQLLAALQKYHHLQSATISMSSTVIIIIYNVSRSLPPLRQYIQLYNIYSVSQTFIVLQQL